MNIDNALKIDGWMNERELGWLASMAAQCATIIEIGSWQGRSATVMADNTHGQIYCVDHFKGAPEIDFLFEGKEPDWVEKEFKKNLEDHLKSGRVKLLQMSSEEGFQILKDQGVMADMVFIDGDHDYKFVSKEIAMYRQLVRSGGVICGHDYGVLQFVGVTYAVHEAFAKDYDIGRLQDTSIWAIKLK